VEPRVEFVVARSERQYQMFRREPLEPGHLPWIVDPARALCDASESWDDLGLRVEFLEEPVEEIGRHDGLVGELSVDCLAGHAVNTADLRPGHSGGLSISQHLVLKEPGTGYKIMDGSNSVPGIGRAKKFFDIRHEGLDLVGKRQLRTHGCQ
jgi:hypothetical protein